MVSTPTQTAQRPLKLPQNAVDDERHLLPAAFQKFAEHFAVYGNLTEAYHHARLPETKQPQREGAKIAALPRVEQAIKLARREAALQCKASTGRIVGELTAIATASPIDFFAEDGTPLPAHKLAPHVGAAVKSIKQTKTENMKMDGTVVTTHTTHVQLHDKLKALQLLGQTEGLFETRNDAPRVVFEVNSPHPSAKVPRGDVSRETTPQTQTTTDVDEMLS